MRLDKDRLRNNEILKKSKFLFLPVINIISGKHNTINNIRTGKKKRDKDTNTVLDRTNAMGFFS